MLKVTAQEYISLGRQMYDAETSFALMPGAQEAPEEQKAYAQEHAARLKYHMTALRDACKKIGLSTSLRLINRRVTDLPQSQREFAVLVDAIWAELDGKLFLFVPPELAAYYDTDGLTLEAAAEFPNVARELRRAGNCYAVGEPTAAVFHAMRGAEICVRVLAQAINARFERPIEQEDWQFILNRIAERFKQIGGDPKSEQRKLDLEFYGPAAAQLQFFKDGWRVRAAHAGELFGEDEAKKAIDHVRELTEILAQRLSENL